MGLLSGWLVGEYRDKANSASNSVGTEFEAELVSIGFVYRSTGICQLVPIGLADSKISKPLSLNPEQVYSNVDSPFTYKNMKPK